jgi:hypothetical protein
MINESNNIFLKNYKKNLSLFHKYIVLLFPLALITGPAIPEIICFLSIIIFLYNSFSEKKFKYFNNIFFYLFLLWASYLIFSSYLSSNTIFSLESTLFYFRFGLFSISIWYLIDHHDDFIKKFFFSMVFVFTLLIFDGFLQYFYGSNILGNQYNPTKARLSSLFGDEWIMGSYLSRLMPLIFALSFYSFKNTKKYLLLLSLFIVLTDVLIYLSGERVAFINLMIATILMIALINQYKKFRLITFIISLFIIFIISFYNDNVRSRMINNTFDQINIFSEDYIADHELFIISSYNMFKENPITGIGPKVYRILCSDEKYFVSSELWNSCSTHPHNTYLQLLAETGIIGFLFVFCLLIFIVFKLFTHFISKLLNKEKYIISDVNVCIYIAIVLTLFPFLPTQNLFNNWINFLYYLPFGFLLAINNKIYQEE